MSLLVDFNTRLCNYFLSSENSDNGAIKSKILTAKENSVLSDNEGNIVETDMFQYNIKNSLFSSVGKIKIIDVKKNKYFFKELHVDTKTSIRNSSFYNYYILKETFLWFLYTELR